MPTYSLQDKKQVPDCLQNAADNERTPDSEPGRHYTAQENPCHDREESE